jgi:hypothetical protein
MSPSDAVVELAAVSGELARLTDEVLASGAAARVDPADLRRLVTTVTRLYAVAEESDATDDNPLAEDVASTDAVVLACALLRARDLNPFDLALWFGRSRVAG